VQKMRLLPCRARALLVLFFSHLPFLCRGWTHDPGRPALDPPRARSLSLSLFLFSVCAALSSSSSLFHLFPWPVCVSFSCFLLIRSSRLISPCCSLLTILEDRTIFVAHFFHSSVTFRVCLFSGWFCVDRFRFYLHLCCCSRL